MQREKLPLHFAAEKQASEAVVKALIAAHPEAAKEKDGVRDDFGLALRICRCPALPRRVTDGSALGAAAFSPCRRTRSSRSS